MKTWGCYMVHKTDFSFSLSLRKEVYVEQNIMSDFTRNTRANFFLILFL